MTQTRETDSSIAYAKEGLYDRLIDMKVLEDSIPFRNNETWAFLKGIPTRHSRIVSRKAICGQASPYS